MNLRALFLQLFCGAVAGYVPGAAFPVLSWGTVGNLLIGAAGGTVGGQLLEYLWAGDSYASEMDIFLASAIGGCAGGALMMIILGLIRTILRRPNAK